jgi:7,8-dihydropterin-6-yl-methyl-4-(beta-D-ribofuranosyl)aminobenzene 5'-phosphate synthase
MTKRPAATLAVWIVAVTVATEEVPAADPPPSVIQRLVAVDSLVIDVLSDDVSDTYVSKTPFATSELPNVVAAGGTVVSGETMCIANLGYGLRLRTRSAGVEHVLLFDVGTEGHAFLHNCRTLGIDLAEVEAIAITHGHWDHMGALPQALPVILAKRGPGRVAVHVNPDMFVERGLRLADGRIIPTEKVISAEQMDAAGATVVNSREARPLLDGHFYYSAEIPRVTAFEKGRADHLARSEGDDWQPDPLLMDERMVVVHVRNLGLVVFSACSHAGIVNVCTEVRRLFPGVPIHAVMGGLHLGGVMERIIPDTVQGLQPFDFKFLIAGHCTGWRAVHALATAYGERVSQSAIGTSYRFEAAAAAAPDSRPHQPRATPSSR